MKAKFVGAIEQVTGSCTWLEHKGTEFLVDCGMYQGGGEEYENRKPFPFKAKNIKFVFLTHSHLDHCGLIPRLYREGFTGLVICTKATAEMAREVLLDAVKLGAPYKKDDVLSVSYDCIDEKRDFTWGHYRVISTNIFAAFFRSAHILGSVSIGISWDKNDLKKSIFFTGDIGKNTEEQCYQPLLKDRMGPRPEYNYVVCESTYGSREVDLENSKPESRVKSLETLLIDSIYKKKGNLVIPTFSQHRTQEILFDLYYLLRVKWNGEIPDIQIGFSLFHYLKTNHLIFKSDDLINSGKMEKLLEDELIPDNIEIELGRYYKKVIRINENEYLNHENELKKQDIVFERKEFKLKKNISVNYEMQFKKEYPKKLEMIGVKYIEAYRLEEVPADILHDDFFNQIVQEIKPFPLNISIHSALGSRISEIYSVELFRKYYNKKTDEKKYSYLNNNIEDLFELKKDEIESELKKLYSLDKIKIGVHSIKKIDNAKELNKETNSVIITSSGMCEGGCVVQHFDKLKNKKNTFALTGYQVKNSNGYLLANLCDFTHEEKKSYKIKYMNKSICLNEINADVKIINGYSGHADQKGLLEYLVVDTKERKFSPSNIILNHGDNDSREDLKEKILLRSKELAEKYHGKYKFDTNVVIPELDSKCYDLDQNKWTEEDINTVTEEEHIVLYEIRELKSAVDELRKMILALVAAV